MRTFAILLSLSTVLVVMAPTIALAQTETDARQMFQEGTEHLVRAQRLRGPSRAQELRQALNLFHRALTVTRSRSILYNIAVCYHLLSRYRDAFTYYNEYLAIEDLSDEDRGQAEEQLARVRPHVALVQVASTPPGATIYVDRRDLSPQGVTPTTVATSPGEHRIIAVLEGHEAAEAPVETALGETREVQLELEALPTRVHIETDPEGAEIRIDDESSEPLGITPLSTTIPAGQHRIYATLDDRSGRTVIEAPPGGELSVEVELAAPTTPGEVTLQVDVPGAIVSVDGEVVGMAPIGDLQLTPGMHRISVNGGDDYQPFSEVVEVGPGHELDLAVHLAPTVPARRYGVWPNVGMVAAIVLGLSAAATGGWAMFLNADLDEIRQSCESRAQDCSEGSVLREEATALGDRIRGMAIAADVLLATSLAAAITSFALMLLNREIEDTSRVTIALSPARGGAFASLSIGGMLRMSP
jgi:hypothetical protein